MRNGKLLYEIFKDEKRTLVKVNELPTYVKQATIAIEDKNFYKHGGVSFVGGILRAMKDTLLRQKLQGGSTITQQFVKSALLTPERTIRRKMREIVLAFWTESIFSKDEILELYLNQVPYGGTAWGVEAASNVYFGKPAGSAHGGAHADHEISHLERGKKPVFSPTSLRYGVLRKVAALRKRAR